MGNHSDWPVRDHRSGHFASVACRLVLDSLWLKTFLSREDDTVERYNLLCLLTTEQRLLLDRDLCPS